MNNLTLAVIVIGLALAFDFTNGFHDSSNIVSTIICSRATSPGIALLIASLSELAGPFLFGTAVAVSIGQNIIDPKVIRLEVVLSGLSGAIVWNLITWRLGMSSSSTHALIGALVGAVIVSVGFGQIQATGLVKVLLSLLISPVIGFIAGYLLLKFTLAVFRNATPKINRFFKTAQIFSSALLALSHGANDAQKTMGIITMSLVSLGLLKSFSVPWWVMAASAATLSLGIASGGWRIIRTVGMKLFRLRPVHGFDTQVAASTVVLGAALAGGPVSTTQVVSSSIMGIGYVANRSHVRWSVAQEMVGAWVITMPVSAIFGGIIITMLHLVKPLFM